MLHLDLVVRPLSASRRAHRLVAFGRRRRWQRRPKVGCCGKCDNVRQDHALVVSELDLKSHRWNRRSAALDRAALHSAALDRGCLKALRIFGLLLLRIPCNGLLDFNQVVLTPATCTLPAGHALRFAVHVGLQAIFLTKRRAPGSTALWIWAIQGHLKDKQDEKSS